MMLSFLTYRQWRANVKGLSDFPQAEWPDQIPLLYYSYHVMVGLGTIFIAVMVLASLLLWRGILYDSPLDAVGAAAVRPLAIYRQHPPDG